jgi:hypothetical protein
MNGNPNPEQYSESQSRMQLLLSDQLYECNPADISKKLHVVHNSLFNESTADCFCVASFNDSTFELVNWSPPAPELIADHASYAQR